MQMDSLRLYQELLLALLNSKKSSVEDFLLHLTMDFEDSY